eukprot:3745216-Pyramimonas_sp.AAC.1
MRHTVFKVNTGGQKGMRADEDTFLNLPVASASHPYTYGEYLTAWIFERNPIAEEEARRRRNGMHGATLSEVPGLFGERHELALAANSGAMTNGMLIILLDIDSNSNIIGIKTAQTSKQVSGSHGHAIKRLNLTKRLYVPGVGHGAAICDKSLRCKILRAERGDPAVAPAVQRLDTYSANLAEGSGENLPAILGLRSMSDMRAILILEQGHERMIILGAEIHLLGIWHSRQRFCHFGLKCDRANMLPSGSDLQVATTCARIPTNLWRCACSMAGEPAQPTEQILHWHGQGAQKAEWRNKTPAIMTA